MATSYDNQGGKGDRIAIITPSNNITWILNYLGNLVELIDGHLHETLLNSSEACSGKYMRFDFGVSKVIDEIIWRMQADANTQGVWKVQGSDNAVDWTDIGTSFTLGGVLTQTITEIAGNVTGYRYYQLAGVSGNMNATASWYREIEFKIEDYVPPGSSDIKTLNGMAYADIKNVDSVVVAGVKQIN